MLRILKHPSLVEATVSIPDDLFRKAEALAARRGLSVPQYFTELLSDQIDTAPGVEQVSPDDPPWMRGFGALSDLGAETRRIEALIEEEFEQVEDRENA